MVKGAFGGWAVVFVPGRAGIWQRSWLAAAFTSVRPLRGCGDHVVPEAVDVAVGDGPG